MPDTWTVRSTAGDLQLNPSFSAAQYQPGGVDTSALVRRDDRVTYQRSGDGLRVPGPFILRGFVQRDDRDLGSMWTELDAIREVVRLATSVERSTSAGVTTYDAFQGGSTPVVTPDGLGGFVVELEFWPGRAIATYVPTGGPVEVLAAAVTFETFNAGTVTRDITVPGGAGAGDLVIITMWCDNAATIDSAPAGTVTLGAAALQPLAVSSIGNTRLWAFAVPGSSAPAVASFQTTAFYGVVTTTVLSGDNLSATDVAATIRIDQAADTPQEVTGTATAGGVQLLIGGLTRFTGGT